MGYVILVHHLECQITTICEKRNYSKHSSFGLFVFQ